MLNLQILFSSGNISSGPAVINMLKKPFTAVGGANNLLNSKKLGGSGTSFGGLNNSAGSRSVFKAQLFNGKLWVFNKNFDC